MGTGGEGIKRKLSPPFPPIFDSAVILSLDLIIDGIQLRTDT